MKDHFSFRETATLERQKGPLASQVVFLNKANGFTISDDPKASVSDTIQFHLNPPAMPKRNRKNSVLK